MILNQNTIEGITSILAKRMEMKVAPSIFATLFNHEEVLFAQGVGQRELDGAEPDSETVYRIASCTKSFIATAVLILRDRGLLNLDQAITDIVPEYRHANNGLQFPAPTIRSLMSMSGGLATDDPWADREEPISNQRFIETIERGVVLTSIPGSLFQYSNLGFALLGQVIERTSGKKFQEFVTDEILVPLEMNRTGFTKDVVPADQLAVGYRKRGEDWLPLEFSGPGAFSAIGGLFSCGTDLTTWSRWFASAFDSSSQETGPLSRASRREMQFIVTAARFDPGLSTLPENLGRHFGYGFGLFVEYDEKFGHFASHSGGYPGFSSHMRWHIPTGLGVVTLENGTYSRAAMGATEILDTVLKEIGFIVPVNVPLPATIDIAEKVDVLVRQWNASVFAEITSRNVAMDIPESERLASVEELKNQIGGLKPESKLIVSESTSDSPLHLKWKLDGQSGALQVEIRLNPVLPWKLQTFKVTKKE